MASVYGRAHEKESETGGIEYNKHMKGAAGAILVLGISLALVIIMYMWIGYIGPTYSATILEKQQANLRKTVWIAIPATSA